MSLSGNLSARWMIRKDFPEVTAIESLAQTKKQPWTIDDFVSVLRLPKCIGRVTERKEKILGYIVYELGRNAIYILNFAVHPEYQHQGIGSSMINHLKQKLQPQQRERLIIDVRENNLQAQKFLRANNFKAVRVMREFFGDLDAYRMVFRKKI